MLHYIFKCFNFIISCPIRKLFNLYCPGCGITRMFKSLFELKLYKAFRYNALVFILLPVFIVYLALEFWCFCKNKVNIMNTKKFNTFWFSLLILVILFGILRNTKLFHFLAPTEL